MISSFNKAGPKRWKLLLLLSLLCVVCGCRATREGANDASGVIVVNAPEAGVVRRILIAEGVRVEAGTPLIEIAVQRPLAPAQTASPGLSAESRAINELKSSEAEIEAARKEVVSHEAEVQRLTPLVANGEASQAQLDGERALYERAQRRLQVAQEAEKNAQSGLLAARQPGQNRSASGSAPAPSEQTVTANASSAGTVRVISARVGDTVTNGQVLATLRADK